jgi:hypothetical protein
MRRNPLIDKKQKKKMLNQVAYIELCRKACNNPVEPRLDETVEDAYWRNVCREVSHHLFPNAPIQFQPTKGGSRGHVYRLRLLGLIEGRRNGSFDPLEVASKYMNEEIERIAAISTN